ncbi:unnamed protein product [Rotaria sordida]|uniref:Dephospho-CoA kinase n=1 Tax=Rotaria sordida TaxID=392033 RepID=A0A818LWJ5_9BILA|nr:unnamed protein product [Rotaria sordida]CAF1334825.1 unnamed protein product [Rotaria sordida]CAF3497338.1 unnamed protein product [Rotaria sordida]CAF3571571.1 unnamed protein product [Rotaria sordida]
MIILGLTGGIATGKTSASEYFKSQGVPIVDADLIARLVVEPDKPAYYHILKHFGHLNILESNNRYIDRKCLGEIIFTNEQMRKQLNKCTHGYIRREAFKQLIKYFFQLKSIVIWDVPLLFEVGLNRYLSHTLVISCDQTIQLDRLKKRDDINDNQQALQRINAQMSLNEKCQRARYVIDNSGTKDVLHKQLKDFLLNIQPNQLNTITWFIILCIPMSFMYGILQFLDFVDAIKYRHKR